MRLAVKKDPGTTPGGGYYYFAQIKPIENEPEAGLYKSMGFIICEVDDDVGEELLAQARAQLNHQIRLSILVDQVENPKGFA